ncbi:CobQ/CobB/MinD/ParA family protein (plasmid) [Stanieria cyanosphaera PCC 7437]|uniref:CobQ/CobB/MinD/ParA family protein n=1 Tax=Stanieria cyanosphaera (strain ATCC 29371 / PCC 7437) TaxID=111780 RepID=K9Y1M7_STAC7|nr:ParA family protein [Stanieria cyanosphaera]AFZ38234.1 CobQ/CobB/MinD/ParA family protein [Stanieria cyanosphaera PCC 7437]
MSQIFAIVNQKGGAGKTTTAVHFAYWLSQQGTVLMVDADAQQSSATWLEELKLPCEIINEPDELFDRLPELAENYDFVIVDGPASFSETTRVILTRADLALIPCKPAGLDMHSTNRVIRLIRQAKDLRGGLPKAALFLNQAKKGTVLLREAKVALSKTGIELLDAVIYDRSIITDAPSQGQVVWQMSGASAKVAASEYDLLFQETSEVLDGKN